MWYMAAVLGGTVAGWCLHRWFIRVGLSELMRRGMKVKLPHR